MEIIQVLVKLETGLPIDWGLIFRCKDGDFFMLFQEKIGTSCNAAADVVEVIMGDPMHKFI